VTYDHSNRAFAANSAAVQQALARASGTWGGYQAWRPFDPDHRLELVKQTPKSANDDTRSHPLCEQPDWKEG
jgi:hypothetical protein